ncbi:TonB-dependent receptor [Bacteroidota bacterium]
MRKQVATGLVYLVFALHLNAQYVLNGRVAEQDGVALEGASVLINELSKGTISNQSGNFSFEDVPEGEYQLIISFIGYETKTSTIRVESSLNLGEIVLIKRSYLGEEVIISAVRAGDKTPMAYTNMDKDQISLRNTGKDIPYIMKLTPSLITSSDAGHGIGYTSMRIRGSDANRINVTINGIPLNDAESHGVFWVDLPELASSTEQIQIQRGVGTSTNGAGAFGASVNLQTNLLNRDPYATYNLSAGSFNTLRNTISAGTGLLKEHFAVDLRLSDLKSDGFIDRSRTDLQSYYLSAGYFGVKSTLKFITFGGFEEVYQSWGGVPSTLLSTDRTYNGMGAYTDTSGQTVYYENQIDHYDQIHYQLHFSRELTRMLHANVALHYTRGKGYYEEYESGQDFSYYSMEYPLTGSDTIYETDLVRRKWLDNDFYGAIASVTYDGRKSNVILGGGWNRYYGLHYGRVIWAQYLGKNAYGHEWYRGTGDKTDWNVYAKYFYNFTDKLTGFADVQLRGITHNIEGTDANNRDVTQEHSFLFFNPKTGLTWLPAEGQRAFVSIARTNREPNRNNYTDAPEGKIPVHERLEDFELGYSMETEVFSGGITLYFMDYTNQLVLTGEINEVGYPVMTNVKDSYRTGAEFEFAINLIDKVRWSGNLTLSRNVILDYTNYIDNWDFWSDPVKEPFQVEEQIGNTTLAFSPSIVASSLLEYQFNKELVFGFSSKYVGEQFIDNSANPAYTLDAYFVNDLQVVYTMEPAWAERIALSVQVSNLLDTEYESNAWLYRYYSGGAESYMDGFYPQAGRHITIGFQLGF